MINSYPRAVLSIILAGVFLSTLGIGTRLLESANGLQLVFYRSIGLLAMMLVVMQLQAGPSAMTRLLKVSKIALVASLCLVGTSIFVVLAITNTSVANAMFVISLTPLVAGLFAWILLKERLSYLTLLAIVIALTGVTVIVSGAFSTQGMVGIVYAFCMLVCYGLFSVALRIGRNIDMLPCIAIHALILIATLPLFLPSLAITANDLVICLALGAFQLGAGLTLFTLASKFIPAAQLTLLAMLEIVLSPFWVWLFANEMPSTSTMVGGAIILTAITLQAAQRQPASIVQ